MPYALVFIMVIGKVRWLSLIDFEGFLFLRVYRLPSPVQVIELFCLEKLGSFTVKWFANSFLQFV